MQSTVRFHALSLAAKPHLNAWSGLNSPDGKCGTSHKDQLEKIHTFQLFKWHGKFIKSHDLGVSTHKDAH